MARRFAPIPAVVFAFVLTLGACTNNGPKAPVATTTVTKGPAASSSPSAGPSPPELNLGVVADLSPQSSDKAFLDGMRVAVDEVNTGGGVAGYRLGISLKDDLGA